MGKSIEELKKFLNQNPIFKNIDVYFVSAWTTKIKSNEAPEVLIAVGLPSLNHIKRMLNVTEQYYEINSSPLETISIFDSSYFENLTLKEG